MSSPTERLDFVLGIDVSHFQQNVDWPAVASGGIQFCFIKASEGANLPDPLFGANWAGAKAAGVLRGAYHFFRPKVAVQPQVDLFVRTVEQLELGDLPPVLDLEFPADWSGIALADRAPLALAWLTAVEAALGVTPIVYSAPAFVVETLGDANALGRFPLWIAEYTSKPAPLVPQPWQSWTFWQHNSQAQVTGVPRPVDHNKFQGSLADLQQMLFGAAAATAGASASGD
jgi:lysozyme